MRGHFLTALISFSVLVSGQSSAKSSSQSPTSTASAAILNPTTVPSCALSCQNLVQAQLKCMPSNPANVLQANTTVYHDCFCRSELTTSLLKSADGICDVECPSEADRVKVRTWYLGYCNGISANSSTPASSTTTSSSSSSVTSTSNTIPASAATTTTSEDVPPKRKSNLSKKTTIGIAVGASVAMIIIAVAVYFPVFSAAKKAMRAKTPSPGDEGEEAGVKEMTRAEREEERDRQFEIDRQAQREKKRMSSVAAARV